MPATRQLKSVIPMDKLKKPRIISHTSRMRKPEIILTMNLKIKRIGADISFIKQYNAATASTMVRIRVRSILSPLNRNKITV